MAENIVARHVRKSFKSCSAVFLFFHASSLLFLATSTYIYKTGIGRIDRIDISRTSFKKNIHWKFFSNHPPGRGNSPPSRRYSGEQVIRNRGGDRVSHFPIRHWKNVSIESEYITRPVLHRRSGGRIRFYMVICTYHLPSRASFCNRANFHSPCLFLRVSTLGRKYESLFTVEN